MKENSPAIANPSVVLEMDPTKETPSATLREDRFEDEGDEMCVERDLFSREENSERSTDQRRENDMEMGEQRQEGRHVREDEDLPSTRRDSPCPRGDGDEPCPNNRDEDDSGGSLDHLENEMHMGLEADWVLSDLVFAIGSHLDHWENEMHMGQDHDNREVDEQARDDRDENDWPISRGRLDDPENEMLVDQDHDNCNVDEQDHDLDDADEQARDDGNADEQDLDDGEEELEEDAAGMRKTPEPNLKPSRGGNNAGKGKGKGKGKSGANLETDEEATDDGRYPIWIDLGGEVCSLRQFSVQAYLPFPLRMRWNAIYFKMKSLRYLSISLVCMEV
jgi:hypothetical protein